MTKKESRFLKEDIIKSERFNNKNKDVLFVILEKEKEYSIKEVEKLYNDFMKKEVK